MKLTSLIKEIETTQAPSEPAGRFAPYSKATKPTDGFSLSNPPAAITPRDYQLAAIEGILENGSVIVGLAPGLGKTAIAIVAAAQTPGNTLVVCPPSLIYTVWVEEFTRLYPDKTINVVHGRKPKPIPEADITIIGDAIIYARLDDLSDRYSTIIMDEAHRFKNPQAQRTQAAIKLADLNRDNANLILLTGTLAVNNPAEVFGPVRVAGLTKQVSQTNRYQDWKERWCFIKTILVDYEKPDGKKAKRPVEIIEGPKEPKELNRRLREEGYFRVERKDILDMPPKLEIVRTVYPSSVDMSEYTRIEKDFLRWVKENLGEDAMKRARMAEKLVKVGALNQAAGLAKVPVAAEYIANLVEEGEQVVVMAHHKEVVKAMTKALKDLKISSATYTGDDSDTQKLNSYQRFKSGMVDVLVGNIQAAGTGLNLENSHHLIFLQLPQSAGDFEQASDRIYRLTQELTCYIHVLLLSVGTVDDKFWKSLDRKRATSSFINTGTLDPVDRLLDSL